MKDTVKQYTNVVVIGGGTGSFVVLSGLKKYADQINLSAIVTVADSGGSAKQERDEFGILPVSDARKALLALSSDTDEKRQSILRDLFNYRFTDGQSGLKGGTFGNLLLVALTNILGSETKAIKEAQNMLNTVGDVVPVSLDSSNLVLKYENEQIIVGEHYLDDFPGDGTKKVTDAYLLPPIVANKQALEKISSADVVILPPGDLFASIISNFLVQGINDSLNNSKAKIVYVVNLMTKYGQTYGLSASDHVNLITQYTGCEIDQVYVNTARVPLSIKRQYLKEKDSPVIDDLIDDKRTIHGDFISYKKFSPQKGDLIKRSLLRHDLAKIASAIMKHTINVG